MEEGYYWITFEGIGELTIGYYDSKLSKKHPWQIVGSDQDYGDNQITVICKVIGLVKKKD